MFRDIGRNQDNLIPPSLRDLIPEDDLIFTIIDIIDQLDLGKLYSRYHRLGQHAYHPKMMLALLFYAYSQGIFSSRKIESHIKDSIRFLFLTGYQYPDFHTIARFRQKNGDLLEEYFTQIVRICLQKGLAPLNAVSVDGTKIKANSSPNQQSKWILKIAAAEDDSVDYKPSGFSDPDCHRMKTIGPGYNAQAAVDTTTQLIVGAKVVNDLNDSQLLLPMIDTVEKVTDTDLQNTKIYADAGYSSANVCAELVQRPKIDAYFPVLKDSTCTKNKLYSKEQFFIDYKTLTVICPEGHTLRLHQKCAYNRKDGYPSMKFIGTKCPDCPVKNYCTKAKYRSISVLYAEPHRQAMREKMETLSGKLAMKIRRSTVETVFGIIKEAMGFRRFHLRTLPAVSAEWFLVVIAFNLKKIHSISKQREISGLAMQKTVKNVCLYRLLLINMAIKKFKSLGNYFHGRNMKTDIVIAKT